MENIIEERDSQYDILLSQMVGRIRSKPGEKFDGCGEVHELIVYCSSSLLI